MGALLVLHAWGLIAGSMALFVSWPNPLTFVLAVMVIGTRQLGLAILMHDAAHGVLFANRRLNEWVGTWICAAPIFSSFALYRPYHLAHHRHTQQAEDPDLGLSVPFPISRRSLWRKVGRDLAGRTAYQRRLEQFRGGLAREWRAFTVNLLLLAALVAAGYWWLYPVLWLGPLATWYQLVSRIRNIAEHAVVPDNDDPLRNTRTTRANWLERLLVAPYRVNYHLEHHLFMFVPCWRLPAAHRALLAAGWGARMEIQPGYRAVLRLATSRQSDEPRAAGERRIAQHI
jgi:fatty acid desaturase